MLRAFDRRLSTRRTNSLGTTSGSSQIILIRDIISEGPIEGLVAGGASIYMNNDSLMAASETPIGASGGTIKVSGTAGNNTLSIISNQHTGLNLTNRNPRTVMVAKVLSGTCTISYFDTVMDVSQSGVDVDYLATEYLVTVSGITLDTAMQTTRQTLGVEISASDLGDKKAIATIGSLDVLLREVTSTTFKFYHADAGLAAVDRPIHLSQIYSVASCTEDEITLVSNLDYDITNKSLSIPGSTNVGTATHGTSNSGITTKYDSASYQLSTGTFNQAPHRSLFGFGTSSINVESNGIGVELEENDPVFIRGGESLSAAQMASVDKLSLTFQYPGGLYRVNTDNGNEHAEPVAYRIEIATQLGVGGNLDNYVKIPGTYIYPGGYTAGDSIFVVLPAANEKIWVHHTKTKDAYTFTEVIDLESYKPFTDFQLKITRLTTSSQDRASTSKWSINWEEHGPSDGIHVSKISSAVALLTDKLNYPYTAHATITFSSKDFSSSPERSYECFGMKVKVPSTYITREENDGINAKYTRDADTGIDTHEATFWEGDFREELVYTDNPAWIFYDILTNNRYGLGEHVKEFYIDQFSLYKISKYCDELVPDGKGGLEPRFRGNYYFTKATDCYKVLKDMATTFRSILYWSDGKLLPIMDAKREPIYTFTKSNVTDGMFAYETTGTKTRPNQMMVSWNNPDNQYKLEPLLIEDRDNIIKTGRVLKDEANAFGCTSYGQALRFGRWKLWTAINQTEVVSFSTSINAMFLAPGDIINIQDNSDYLIYSSGRLKSDNTTTELKLDREVTLTAGDTYEIVVIFTGVKAFLEQDSATIDGEEYTHGDVIPNITTQQEAASVFDSVTGDPVLLQFTDSTYLETKAVNSISEVNGVYVLSCDAFSEAPQNNAVWAIKHVNADGDVVETSPKMYKIMSIAEEEVNKYSIVAVEHFDEKFDAVEGDFIVDIDDPVYPTEDIKYDVPSIRNLKVSKKPKSYTSGEDIIVSWTAPGSAYNSSLSEVYEHLAGYELEYYDQDERVSVILSPNTNSYILDLNTIDDFVIVSVRVISSEGRYSFKSSVQFNLSEEGTGDSIRNNSIKVGGLANKNFTLDTSTGDIVLSTNTVLGILANLENNSPKELLQETTISANIMADESTAYLLADYSELDSSSPIKLVEYIATPAISYWREVGTSAPTQASSGTVSASEGSSKVVGSGTSFTTVFAKGQKYIEIGGIFARVSGVESDSILYVDRVFEQSYSNVAYKIPALELDYTNDFLIGAISTTGTSTSKVYTKVSYLTIDPELVASYLDVYITSSDAGFVFKNNAGTAKTLTANARDSITGELVDPVDCTYRWVYSGTDPEEAVYVDASNLVVPSTDTGAIEAVEQTIIVGPEDVPNGESIAIRCEVTV